MTARVALAAFALAVLAFAACGSGTGGPAGDRTGDPSRVARSPAGTYHLSFEVAEMTGGEVLTANGFPVWTQRVVARSARDYVAPALTSALVTGRNTAAALVTPALERSGPGGRTLVVHPVVFSLGVLRSGPEGASWVEGTVVPTDSVRARFGRYTEEVRRRWAGWLSTEDSLLAARPALADSLAGRLAASGRSYGSGPARDSARAWTRAHPFTVEVSFVRPGGPAPSDGQPSFDAVLRDAPVVGGTAADSAALRAYAVRLRALVEARDGAALYDAFEVAVRDGARAGGRTLPPPATLRARWDSLARAGGSLALALRGGPLEPFSEGDVRLRSWAGGRVWELYRGPGEPLLAEPWDGAGRLTESVYVGRGPGGALRVVR